MEWDDFVKDMYTQMQPKTKEKNFNEGIKDKIYKRLYFVFGECIESKEWNDRDKNDIKEWKKEMAEIKEELEKLCEKEEELEKLWEKETRESLLRIMGKALSDLNDIRTIIRTYLEQHEWETSPKGKWNGKDIFNNMFFEDRDCEWENKHLLKCGERRKPGVYYKRSTYERREIELIFNEEYNMCTIGDNSLKLDFVSRDNYNRFLRVDLCDEDRIKNKLKESIKDLENKMSNRENRIEEIVLSWLKFRHRLEDNNYKDEGKREKDIDNYLSLPWKVIKEFKEYKRFSKAKKKKERMLYLLLGSLSESQKEVVIESLVDEITEGIVGEITESDIYDFIHRLEYEELPGEVDLLSDYFTEDDADFFRLLLTLIPDGKNKNSKYQRIKKGEWWVLDIEDRERIVKTVSDLSDKYWKWQFFDINEIEKRLIHPRTWLLDYYKQCIDKQRDWLEECISDEEKEKDSRDNKKEEEKKQGNPSGVVEILEGLIDYSRRLFDYLDIKWWEYSQEHDPISEAVEQMSDEI